MDYRVSARAKTDENTIKVLRNGSNERNRSSQTAATVFAAVPVVWIVDVSTTHSGATRCGQKILGGTGGRFFGGEGYAHQKKIVER